MTHEHASLNAALGYAAVSGKPSVTAAHVDCGTQHYGGAIHTAWHSGLPILITAGIPPVAYPGSMRGAREPEGHLWLQQTFDQNGIVRQYMKWDHQLEFQDNPGLIVSRALQVACTEPRGPVYLSMPREVSLADRRRRELPEPRATRRRPAAGAGAGRHYGACGAAGPGEQSLHRGRPLRAQSRDGAGARPAVPNCSAVAGRAVRQARLSLLSDDAPALPGLRTSLSEADLVLALDVDIPWMPGPNGPPDDAYVAIVDVEPSKRRIPTMEFTADLRLTADALLTIEAIEAEIRAA